MSRLTKLGPCVSQTINAVIFNGHPNESLSARTYLASRDSKKWMYIRECIDWWFSPFEDEHCKRSHETDLRYVHDAMNAWDLADY